MFNKYLIKNNALLFIFQRTAAGRILKWKGLTSMGRKGNINIIIWLNTVVVSYCIHKLIFDHQASTIVLQYTYFHYICPTPYNDFCRTTFFNSWYSWFITILVLILPLEQSGLFNCPFVLYEFVFNQNSLFTAIPVVNQLRKTYLPLLVIYLFWL